MIEIGAKLIGAHVVGVEQTSKPDGLVVVADLVA